jgi:hypothetical protein
MPKITDRELEKLKKYQSENKEIIFSNVSIELKINIRKVVRYFTDLKHKI